MQIHTYTYIHIHTYTYITYILAYTHTNSLSLSFSLLLSVSFLLSLSLSLSHEMNHRRQQTVATLTVRQQGAHGIFEHARVKLRQRTRPLSHGAGVCPHCLRQRNISSFCRRHSSGCPLHTLHTWPISPIYWRLRRNSGKSEPWLFTAEGH